jgi:hypothetical protein
MDYEQNKFVSTETTPQSEYGYSNIQSWTKRDSLNISQPNSYPDLIKNQNTTQMDDLEKLSKSLKSNSTLVKCPYCNETIMTDSETTCSFSNTLCCIFFGLAPWIIFQCVRGKDIKCMDASHFCPKCKQSLGDYKAC